MRTCRALQPLKVWDAGLPLQFRCRLLFKMGTVRCRARLIYSVIADLSDD